MTRSGTQLYLAAAIALSSAVSGAIARAGEPTSCEESCPHEYGPIQQVAVSELSPASKAIVEDFLAGFSGPTLSGGNVDARARAGRSRVLLLSIFAEWCCNCRMEAPKLVELIETWGPRGFAVIGRSEYSAPIEVRRHVREFGVSWPVVLGSRNPDPQNEDRVRTTTAHFRLSRLFGSERKWSTPYNVLVVDGDFDTFYIADGEYEPGALEEFLAEHLDTAPDRASAGRV